MGSLLSCFQKDRQTASKSYYPGPAGKNALCLLFTQISVISLTVHYVCEKQSVSPELLECRKLELAVPGTYRAGKIEFIFTISLWF